jgi:hypothetical protein
MHEPRERQAEAEEGNKEWFHGRMTVTLDRSLHFAEACGPLSRLTGPSPERWFKYRSSRIDRRFQTACVLTGDPRNPLVDMPLRPGYSSRLCHDRTRREAKE